MTNRPYLVEEFVENEPTGRSWRVSAEDAMHAALQAVEEEKKRLAEKGPFRFKVSPRNRFGQTHFISVRAARTWAIPNSGDAAYGAR